MLPTCTAVIAVATPALEDWVTSVIATPISANIGTTITGWLVALLGFKLSLGDLVLPLIFLGALMRLFGLRLYDDHYDNKPILGRQQRYV